MQFTMKQRGSSNNIVMKSSGTPVDTPTVVRSIVEMLEDPSEHTYDKIKAPPPQPTARQPSSKEEGTEGAPSSSTPLSSSSQPRTVTRSTPTATSPLWSGRPSRPQRPSRTQTR